MPTLFTTVVMMRMLEDEADKGLQSHKDNIVLDFRLFRHWHIENKIKAGLWGETLASEGRWDLRSKIKL